MRKKRVSSLMREKRKVYRNLHGIRNMEKLPGAMLVVAPRKEKNAVQEANRLGIPVIAILDTDCDPDPVDIVIPGNDDAMRSINLLLGKLTESIAAGNTAHAQFLAEEEKRQAEEEAKRQEEQAKLAEAQKRRKAERDALKAAQDKLRKEREKAGGGEAQGGETPPAPPPAESGSATPPPATESGGDTPADMPEGETRPGPEGPEKAD